ncbi:MAG: S8 family serine peptidase [Lewinellaceae bacterium]|nr:S8 family serine peptidase [Lewinellaceae bacterium]
MKLCYALLLALASCLPVSAQQTYPVQFNFGTEFFPENFSGLRSASPTSEDEVLNGYVIRYLQCYQIPTAEARAVPEKAGVVFISYVHFGVYLVALPENFDLRQLDILHPRSLVPVKPEWKMANSLRERPFGDWAVHGHLLDINIQVYPQVGISRGAERCRDLGFTVLQEGNQNGFLQLRLPAGELEKLAAQPWVQLMELTPPPGEPDDTRGRALHRSNLLDNAHPSGLKLNGAGVNVLVRDDGPLGPHIDFRGRQRDYSEFGADGIHADGVAGILGGAGNLNPVARGMAPGANIYTIRYSPEFQDQTLALHLNENVTITNTSYSNGCNVGYTIATQTVDQQLFEHPALLHVFSAGNSNNISNCLSYGAGNQWGNITGGHKMAKNAIVAANVTADGIIVSNSSRGPAYDGRLKPDISANGNDQESTDHNNAYFIFGGTSAAAPGIAGVLAQLTQAYQSAHNGQQPESVLLKAALLNTANDLGNTGPDFIYGWGHVNAWRAFRLLEQNNWLQQQTDQGGETVHTLQIPQGVRQARIMICWADPPASVNASKSLLNDLDIKVLSPSGVQNLPWKLDPTPNPLLLNLPAGKGRDSLNNMEQVSIDNPAAGLYSVVVKGTAVPFGPQPYVLVWEFLTDDVRLTYPVGGEGFVPGEVERIHWDAFGNQGIFSLRYSTDDGFSWQQIADVAGDQRMFDWQVPDVVSGRVRLLVQRSLSSHASDYPLSISPVPENIQVEKVCPHSMTLSWTPAKDTLPSDIYLLGGKYMEITGTTASNTFTFPIQNGGTEKWVSVRARNSNGLAGRRAIALQWPGELKNCQQPDDLGLRELTSPDGEPTFGCAPFLLPVTVQLHNEGTNTVAGAMLHYQVNDKPLVSQSVPAISPGGMLGFTFQNPILIAENEWINLKIWSTYAPEDAFFNDTLRVSFPAVAQPVKGYMTEGFEGFDFPPFGWRIPPPDGTLTWLKTTQNVTGSDG